MSIRKIGNAQGVVIPKPLLAQVGSQAGQAVEMTVVAGALVLRRPTASFRAGWAEAARKIEGAEDYCVIISP